MKVNKLTPNFEVSDIRKTVAFYSENLGFNLVMAVPETQDGIVQDLTDDKEYVYALMQRDNAELMFQRSDTFKHDVAFLKDISIGASVSFYIEIDGISEFYAQINRKKLQATELKTAWYGMREFYLKDINGYVLGFAEKANEK